jgi:hypothetical protein
VLLACLVFDILGQIGYGIAWEKWHFVAVSVLFASVGTMSFPAATGITLFARGGWECGVVMCKCLCATGIVSNEVDATEQGIMMASISAVRELTGYVTLFVSIPFVHSLLFGITWLCHSSFECIVQIVLQVHYYLG